MRKIYKSGPSSIDRYETGSPIYTVMAHLFRGWYEKPNDMYYTRVLEDHSESLSILTVHVPSALILVWKKHMIEWTVLLRDTLHQTSLGKSVANRRQTY